MKWVLVSALSALALGACGGDKTSGGGSGDAGGAIPLAEINTLGGEHVQFKVATVGDDSDEHIKAAVPVGWDTSMFGFKPPKSMDLGFSTQIRMSTNCDGTCEPKDWKPIVDKINIQPYRGDRYKLIRETPLTNPSGHLLVVEEDGGFGKRIHISAARYKPGAPRYMTCSATLEEKALPMADAFAKACETARPLFLE